MTDLKDHLIASAPKVYVNCAESDKFLYRLNTSFNNDLVMNAYKIINTTPQGVWISLSSFAEARKFVLLSARKRWACPTHAEAFESFIRRKKRQISILSSQLDSAKEQLETIQKFVKEKENLR